MPLSENIDGLSRANLKLLLVKRWRRIVNVFDRLVSLFTNENARFRIIQHTPEGRSDLVAGVRGTTIAQGAKAIVCAIPVEGREHYVLAVLPG
jgi:Ala-tRNA(Pro) deacylase